MGVVSWKKRFLALRGSAKAVNQCACHVVPGTQRRLYLALVGLLQVLQARLEPGEVPSKGWITRGLLLQRFSRARLCDSTRRPSKAQVQATQR